MWWVNIGISREGGMVYPPINRPGDIFTNTFQYDPGHYNLTCVFIHFNPISASNVDFWQYVRTYIPTLAIRHICCCIFMLAWPACAESVPQQGQMTVSKYLSMPRWCWNRVLPAWVGLSRCLRACVCVFVSATPPGAPVVEDREAVVLSSKGHSYHAD